MNRTRFCFWMPPRRRLRNFCSFLNENRPQERWTGEKLGPGPEAERATGFGKVLAQMPSLTATLQKASERAKAPSGAEGRRRLTIAYLRQVKSPTEIAAPRKGDPDHDESTSRPQRRPSGRGVMEYEVEAALEYEFRRNGAERPGFPSIVGSGPFSTILHYDKSNRRMESGDVVVVDIGAEYGGYSADVTRTYPVSGKFSARQREIYQIVLDAQKAAIAKVKPGATIQRHPSGRHALHPLQRLREVFHSRHQPSHRPGGSRRGQNRPRPSSRIW